MYNMCYSRTSNKGPSEKGTTSLQGTLPISQKRIYDTFQLLKRGQPPYNGQNGWSQSVLYSEVTLYTISPWFLCQRTD